MSYDLDFRLMPKWMPDALDIMALVETWARGYEVPREAILRQIPIAYAWAESNKKRAPKKDPVRFLFSWMRLAKKHYNLTVIPRTDKYIEEPTVEDMDIEEMIAIRKKNMGGH